MYPKKELFVNFFARSVHPETKLDGNDTNHVKADPDKNKGKNELLMPLCKQLLHTVQEIINLHLY